MRRSRLFPMVAVLALAACAALVWLAAGGRLRAPSDAGTGDARAPDATGADAAATGEPGLGPSPGLDPAGPRGAPAPAPAPDAGARPRVRAVGRVVGERRRPAAGVAVRLLAAGAAPLSSTSGPDGAFAFDLPGEEPGDYAEVALHATGPGGRAGLDIVGFSFPARGGPPVNLGTVELRPSFPTSVRVLDVGGPVRGATVAATVVVGFSAARLAEARTGDGGVAALDGLPAGWVQFLATAPDGRRGRGEARLPRADAAPLDVLLGGERTLVVTVLEDETDRPVVGASIEVWIPMQTRDNLGSWVRHDPPLPVPPTGADGRSSVRGLRAGDAVRVSVVAAGRPGHAAREPAADAAEVTLRLPRPRTVTFRLEPGEAPPPPEGAEIRVREWPSEPDLPPVARVRDGTLVVEGATPSDARGLAVAPDGSLAELHARGDEAEGVPTSFRRPRRIEVRAKEEGGAALAGVGVQVRGEGGEDWGPPVVTDAEGLAVIDGLPARSLTVHAGVTPLDSWGSDVDEVDLAGGDARVEVVLGAERTLDVAVRVDGEPRLPVGLECSAYGAVVLAISEDAEAGRVLLRVRPWQPSDPGRVDVRGTGYQTGAAAFSWGAPGATVSAAVDLRRKATIVATVRARPGADVAVSLQAAAADGSGRWSTAQYSLPLLQKAGEHCLDDLLPGTYRLVDLHTGLFVAGIGIEPGEEARVVLDLSDVYEVSGRVVVPDGYEAGRAQVACEGRGMDTENEWGPGKRVRRDGTFTVSVPGGRPVTLRALHPDLDPDPKASVVVVTGPRSDVALSLIERASALLRLVLPAGATLAEDADGWVTVDSEPSGEASSHHRLERTTEGTWRFAGHRPGKWTVVLFLDGFPPRELRGVDLPPGRVDLGEVALERGSTVTVHLLLREGEKPPEIHGGFQFAGEPAYDRDWEQEGDALRARGLGAGTFRATFSWETRDGRGRSVEREVTVDGRTDLSIDLDVR